MFTCHDSRGIAPLISRVPEITLDAWAEYGRVPFPCAGMNRTALIFWPSFTQAAMESWKFRVFGAGVQTVALSRWPKHLGVEICPNGAACSYPRRSRRLSRHPAPPPPRTPTPTPTPTRTPLQVQPRLPFPRPSQFGQPFESESGTSRNNPVSLTKRARGRFGKMKIQPETGIKPDRKRRAFLLQRLQSPIDLDLGAFVETRDGKDNIVHSGALGNGLSGDFRRLPLCAIWARGMIVLAPLPTGEWA